MTKKILVTTSTFAIALAMVSGLSSCQDEDLGVSETVLKERAFEQGFTKAFGQPSADQSWDFYNEKLRSLKGNLVEEEASEDAETSDMTRATMATISIDDAEQPASVQENSSIWTDLMPEGQNNATKGQNFFSLVSSGTFTISAVQYSGRYEDNSDFRVGIRYRDNNNRLQKVTLFGPSEISGNPGFAKTVTLTEGAEFDLFVEYGGFIFTHTYYTDEYPNLLNAFTGRFDGPALLLYTGESETEKVMVIGFEEDWGLIVGLRNDLDFNDVVLYISGNLPMASPKRYFAEDLKSLDFDYNDVVFDVTNAGITLRAVGGTLPVYLRVKDKKNKTTTTQELHELMGGSTYVDSKGETFYQPINVGGKNGITKDAVKIVTWTDNEGTRLTNEELAAFNDVTLLVAKKFGATATALTNVDDFTEVNPQNPALLTVPSETPWMKELTRIDKGYPNFFGSGWYEESNSEYLYK
jgi:hypothetical protein